jgi:hypothetical protein
MKPPFTLVKPAFFVYVKKPECPARSSSVAVLLRRVGKSGDEWPSELEANGPQVKMAFSLARFGENVTSIDNQAKLLPRFNLIDFIRKTKTDSAVQDQV